MLQLLTPSQAQAEPAAQLLLEPLSQAWSLQLSGWQTREWSDGDGKGHWTEYQRGDRHYFTRSYQDGRESWTEALEGKNHWRNRAGGYAGLAEEAEAAGY